MDKGYKIVRFTVPVDCMGERFSDNGFLFLPQNYSDIGEPVRLVISCHGAGGTVSTDDSQVEQQALTKYLVANGYAVMDVNGLPEEFAKNKGIDIRNNIGSPIAVESYIKAYKYCVERFNIKKQVFVHGASMGGISSTNLVMSGSIPVLAQSGFCPVLDAYGQIFLHPWSDGLPKYAMGKLYRLNTDKNGEYIYDSEKIGGNNPTSKITAKSDGEYLDYPVPVKFWQCEDDDVVDISCTVRFVRAIKNAGGDACLVTFPTGKHEPQDVCGEVRPIGNTVLAGEKINITPAVEGVFEWIKKWDKPLFC